MITVLTATGDTDRDGRASMPGEKALRLDSGKLGVYYEEPVKTTTNEVFNAPGGIRLRVTGLEDALDPELKLGGAGNQVETEHRSAEQIGTLRVKEDGRYHVSVGRSRDSSRAEITVGATGGEAFARAGCRVGYVAAGLAVLGLLRWVWRRLRRA